ncbi:YaiI/YqxD family protein [Alteribacter aurantiacus]|uniref:YaiI/YqxD family protein n=1 Tax=Alteribacter aurantiacus TaxID=254410 RepID=UPI0003F8FDC9|nr:YaiI/YqxD family protein [Alteribacter aurantiacus]
MSDNFKTVFIDGDACPVRDEAISIAGRFQLPVVLVSSYAHETSKVFPPHVQKITVDQEAEAADMAIVKNVKKGDVVVTQDHGLAGLLIAKGVHVLTPRGKIVTDLYINTLLSIRHDQGKLRRAGKKTKGPKKMTDADRNHFEDQFEKILSNRQEF